MRFLRPFHPPKGACGYPSLSRRRPRDEGEAHTAGYQSNVNVGKKLKERTDEF